MKKIPFVDLHAQYLTIKTEIDAAIFDVIEHSNFIRGPYVELFEKEFAKVLGVQHCISCANGTDSLYIAMKALGLKDGDEVIVPAHSWISSSETVTQAGGIPIFCDTNSKSFTIDVKKIKEKISKKTVGIIPVHLYGQPADMDEVMAISKAYKLWVLEDCAQSHLSKYKNFLTGTFGHAASFSFYPGKNLGAMGDAGAIITNNDELANKMTMFARHGGLKKGDHQIEGINSRMDGLQAAILSVKLKRLSAWTKKRQEIANLYSTLLKDVSEIVTPIPLNGREHVWHLYVIQAEKRDELALHLKNNGIDTVINYPVALPFLPAYKRFNHQHDDFPVAYYHQSRILSLPIFPEMQEEDILRVVNSIKNFYIK
jgi:dTDP-4-amino-4,6-dideoxygalactose transaminase